MIHEDGQLLPGHSASSRLAPTWLINLPLTPDKIPAPTSQPSNTARRLLPPDCISIRPAGPNKGRGLFTECEVRRDCIAVEEEAMAAFQHLTNAQEAWVCANCFAFLGSLGDQLRWHRRRAIAMALESAEDCDEEEGDGDCEGEDDNGEGEGHGKEVGEEVEDEEEPNENLLEGKQKGKVTEKAQANEKEKDNAEAEEEAEESEVDEFVDLPFKKGFDFATKQIPCHGGCGAIYCSDECEAEAWKRQHRLLCVGPLESEQHPLVLFKEHAILSHELFLMAAKMIATMIIRYEEHQQQAEKITSKILGNDDESLTFLSDEFLSCFTHRHWWEVADLEDYKLTAEEAKELVVQSLDLLTKAFVELGVLPRTGTSPYSCLFTFDFYSKMLGMLELNNNSIDIVSPVTRYVSALQKKAYSGNKKAEAFLQNVVTPLIDDLMNADYEHNDEHDSDDEDHKEYGEQIAEASEKEEQPFVPFPAAQGFGIFPIAAMMNHSCDPNCIVMFGTNNTARVTALRDIAAGEELTHSYIENLWNLEKRRRELSEYGFLCTCAKCTKEFGNDVAKEEKDEDENTDQESNKEKKRDEGDKDENGKGKETRTTTAI